jgi:protein-tyrosine phosphatase
MKSILFVCMGNICRSPVVAEVARNEFARAGLSIEIDSAGTGNYHIGGRADERAIGSAKAHGYDLSAHRARQVRAEDFSHFDAVLAMDRVNLATLKSNSPAGHRAEVALFLPYSGLEAPSEVPDPYYGHPEDFERVIELARSGVKGLLGRHRDGA